MPQGHAGIVTANTERLYSWVDSTAQIVGHSFGMREQSTNHELGDKWHECSHAPCEPIAWGHARKLESVADGDNGNERGTFLTATFENEHSHHTRAIRHLVTFAPPAASDEIRFGTTAYLSGLAQTVVTLLVPAGAVHRDTYVRCRRLGAEWIDGSQLIEVVEDQSKPEDMDPRWLVWTAVLTNRTTEIYQFKCIAGFHM
jgi:hypothetical protein